MLTYDVILCCAFMAAVLFLFFTSKWDVAKYNNKWRLLYLLPTLICIVHALAFGTEFCLSGIYIGALIMLGGYLMLTVSVRKSCSVFAALLCIFTIPVCLFSTNYRTADYLADFENGFTLMKEHYSLSEHKNVDWDSLYEKYVPLFEQVQKEQDENANIATWLQFCNEFYDFHTSYFPLDDSEDIRKAVAESVVGNDYGLSMVQLSSGEYVAVLVEENSQAKNAGIHTGTIITKWDGKVISHLLPAASERMKKCILVGNKENEAFYESLFVPGLGGEQVQVSFLDDNGEEKEVTLSSLGSYYQRFKEAYDILLYKTPRENMSVVQLNTDTVLLNVNMMVSDSQSMETVNYGALQSGIRQQLITYKETGASNLIIDLRNNSGGSSMMARAIVSLFAEGEIFWAADGAYNEQTGNYETIKSYTCMGENLWNGGRIIVLVNSGSNSAANHLIAGMKRLENVTVMGISEPAGTAQGVGDIVLEHGIFSFSKTLVLNENEEIWVDSNESGHCRLPVDEKVELTLNAIEKMFDEKTDYVLEYAVERFREE